ncbi:unnamed protein product [Heligmosomoides polygyrus]|uniref:Trypsin Inhibitor like cysteine rich domain protein n=1 Tax=Heligmosomoides polygyrus TaxID=6339 RepID=A0A183FF46_HELPZ|nr:unnamed protein product [Heligmosomoides polygyrus]
MANCQCKSGFLRNSNGACVANCTDDSSTPTCGPNSVFNECGSACEPTCRDPKPVASSNVCPENEEFKQCGTACEPTCENPNPLVCTLQCLVNVCQCKPGFFRNSMNKCVSSCGSGEPLPSKKTLLAPFIHTCGVNEEKKRCGTACEPTCANPIQKCTKQCIPDVCQCKDGFIRNANNICIPLQDCARSH